MPTLDISDLTRLGVCEWDFLTHRLPTAPEVQFGDTDDEFHRYLATLTRDFQAGLALHPKRLLPFLEQAGISTKTPVRASANIRLTVPTSATINGEKVALSGTIPITVSTTDPVTGGTLNLVGLGKYSAHMRSRVRANMAGIAYLTAKRDRASGETVTTARRAIGELACPAAGEQLRSWRTAERLPRGDYFEQVLLFLADGNLKSEHFDELIAEAKNLIARAAELLENWGNHEIGETCWRRVQVCGGCAACTGAVAAYDDVLAVSGLGPNTRTDAHRQGIFTVKELADADLRAIGSLRPVFVERAGMLLKQRETGELLYSINHDSPLLGALPNPGDQDLYLDFENDSLWGWTRTDHTGLVYLAGYWLDGEYHALWAHDRESEATMYKQLTAEIVAHLEAYPEARVYHYSSQEREYFRRLQRRHRFEHPGFERFTDLFEVARSALTTGTGGMTLKDLEPLYLGEQARGTNISDGGMAAVRFHQLFTSAGDAANLPPEKLYELAEYNRQDCVSTMRLHHWLAAQRRL
ncbi:MAG: ribonuclease H-like domain-containing protein [Varibaculum sp.]|nr:ribonuclease H-like domain-containing protein [Varibaculum sp.]